MRAPLFSAALCLLLPAVAAAQTTDLTNLSLEVAALQALQDLELEPDQLRAVAKLARGAGAEKPAPKAVKASAEFVKTLKALHAALVKGDDERVADLQAKYDDLREKETLDLGDRVALTDAARKQAPQFQKLLTVRQLGGLIGNIELVGPRDRLVEALDGIRGLSANDMKELRDGVAEEVGWLVAGFDAKRADDMKGKAAALLDEAYKLKDADFKKQRGALEAKAKRLVGATDNMRVLANLVQHYLAEVLSNPAFEKALELQLKK